MIYIFLIVIVLVVVSKIYSGYQLSQEQSAKRAYLQKQLSDLTPDELFVSEDQSSAIGISFKRQSVILLGNNNVREYGFEKIASAEVLKDEVSLTQTNRGSQLLGAAAGELLLGPIGLLAGSLSGSKRTSQRFYRLELKLIVDCTTQPVYVIRFFQSSDKKGSSNRDPIAAAAIERTDRYHAHLVNGMRNVASTAQRNNLQLTDRSSTQASLRELWELKQLGALTEDEFTAAKQRLLPPSERI